MYSKDSAANLKRKQLQKVYDKAVELRSHAYMWNDIPPDALEHLEIACEHLHLCVSHFDVYFNN